MTLYDDIDLGQHWPDNIVITWNNVDQASVGSFGMLRAISQEMPNLSILEPENHVFMITVSSLSRDWPMSWQKSPCIDLHKKYCWFPLWLSGLLKPTGALAKGETNGLIWRSMVCGYPCLFSSDCVLWKCFLVKYVDSFVHGPVYTWILLDHTVAADVMWPLLLTWFNFNPSMDK